MSLVWKSRFCPKVKFILKEPELVFLCSGYNLSISISPLSSLLLPPPRTCSLSHTCSHMCHMGKMTLDPFAPLKTWPVTAGSLESFQACLPQPLRVTEFSFFVLTSKSLCTKPKVQGRPRKPVQRQTEP